MAKRNNYVGALWLACKLLARENPSQENIESWFNSILMSVTETDTEQVNKFLNRKYREEHKEQIIAYRREYKKQQLLKMLREE